MPTEGAGPSAGSRGEEIVRAIERECFGPGGMVPEALRPNIVRIIGERVVAALASVEKERDEALVKLWAARLERGWQDKQIASAREALRKIAVHKCWTAVSGCVCLSCIARAALGEGAPPAAPPEPEWEPCPNCGQRVLGTCEPVPCAPPSPAPTEAPSADRNPADPPQPEPSRASNPYREIAAKFHDALVGAGRAGAYNAALAEEADNEFCALEEPAPSPADPRADGDAEKLIRETTNKLWALPLRDSVIRTILRDFASRVRGTETSYKAAYADAVKVLGMARMEAADLRTGLRGAERKLAEVTRAKDVIEGERESFRRVAERLEGEKAAAVRDTWDKATKVTREVDLRPALGKSTSIYSHERTLILAALHAARAQDEKENPKS